MGKHKLSQTKILFDGYDFSGDLNSILFELEHDDHDSTAFGTEAHDHTMGMGKHSLAFSGFLNLGDSQSEGVLKAAQGSEKIVTICPENSTVESVAYAVKSMAGKMSLGGQVAGMAVFSGAGISKGTAAIRGVVGAAGAKTATGDSSAINLGAVAAGKYLYGVLHCTAVSGTDTPTITVKIQSCAASNFSSGVTDRITFTAVTAVGAQWATAVAGPVTDEYWRVSWTVSGTNPSLTIYAVIAIQ